MTTDNVVTIIVALLGSAVVSAMVTILGERGRAREERRQTRLAETYVDVVDSTFRARDWVDRTMPFIHEAGEPGPPAFLSDDEQRRLLARLSAYGSPRMLEAYRSVIKAFSKFRFAADERAHADRTLEGQALMDVHDDFDEARKHARQAVDRLADLANAELAERRHHRWLLSLS